MVEKNKIFIGCLDKLSSAQLNHERLKQVLVYMSTSLSADFGSTTIRRVEEGGGRRGWERGGWKGFLPFES